MPIAREINGKKLVTQRNLWVQKWDWLALAALWLAVASSDRFWVHLDRSVPNWEQSEYLVGALNYWQHWQQFQWSSAWWQGLWRLSPSSPLTPLLTVPIFNLCGKGVDQAVLVNLIFTAILLPAIYALGTRLFNRWVGLWAAVICLLVPGLYQLRLNYLPDYPLVAMVALSYCCLTFWWSLGQPAPFYGQLGKTDSNQLRRNQWLWSAALGLSMGLALLSKLTAGLFLAVPLAWVGYCLVHHKLWERLLQLLVSLLLTALLLAPWVQTNWFLMFSMVPRSPLVAAPQAGEPALISRSAWTYYLQVLPHLVGWFLFLVPIIAILLYWRSAVVGRQWTMATGEVSQSRAEKLAAFVASRRSLLWLAIFWLGGYFLSAFNPQPAPRYITPLLPITAVFLAYGLTLIPKCWRAIASGTLAATALLATLNLFPVLPKSMAIPAFQNSYTLAQAYLGPNLPHLQIINEIAQTEPNLRATVGVLTSTPEVNPHNINFYGLLQNSQLQGQQVGNSKAIEPEIQLLSWFLVQLDAKGQPQVQSAKGLLPKQQMLQILEKSGNFQLQKLWQLPHGETLKLFHRRIPTLEVHPISQKPAAAAKALPVQLTQTLVTQQAQPGQLVPITYRWSGSWQALQDSLILLTWQLETPAEQQADPSKDVGTGGAKEVLNQIPARKVAGEKRWLHDHAIALGKLSRLPAEAKAERYEVVERLAMLPPTNLIAGTYLLKATYLNRHTGKTSALPTPPTRIEVSPTAPLQSSPFPLDPLTQFRQQAVMVRQRGNTYEQFSSQVEVLNKADPDQDYLEQIRQSMNYRLQQEPANRDFAYTLALNHLLKQRFESVIATLQTVVKLDSRNPHAYSDLAVANLYAFRPKAAQSAIATALKLNPNQPALYPLKSTAALMRGNLMQAWQDWQIAQTKEKRQKAHK